MRARIIRENDLSRLTDLHGKFYNGEFEFPNLSHFLGGFVIVDDNDDKDIISFGGLRTILEGVCITNLDKSSRERREALYKLNQCLSFLANGNGYEQIHAFVTDDVWKDILKRSVGFQTCKGEALYLNIS